MQAAGPFPYAPERADVVVVGGGSAGCVVAARLSADPGTRVVLVEEGPDPNPVPDVIADPRRQAELITETDLVRRLPVRRPDGSTFPLLSGRVVGGGSSVNNLAVLRPMGVDFEDWARVGGERWSHAALLPLMRAIEDDADFPDHPLHGRGGPMRLERDHHLDDVSDPVLQALLVAADDLGIPRCADLHVAEPLGICSSPYNLRDGRRLSTAVAYLDPVRARPNLGVLAGSTAVRVLLDGTRATGVEIRGPDGTLRTIRAARVVLAAGVFHSPQVLMRSGIGPRAKLDGHGIPVELELDGVGRGFQDHAVVYVAFAPGRALAEGGSVPKVRLILRSDPDRLSPDLHVLFHPPTRSAAGAWQIPVSVRLLEHHARGRVRLASTDPEALPVVEPALLEHPTDLTAMARGIAQVERLLGHGAMAPFYGPLVQPAAGGDRAAFIRSTYISYHHGVGTCRLGPADDPGAVVDPSLRVHGTSGLWVADASVLPTVPHANTNLAAILIGEIAARSVAAA